MGKTLSARGFPAFYAPTSRRAILTPGAFARKHLMYLQEVGQYRLLKAGHETHRANLESFLLVSVQEGAGELTYEGRIYRVEAGSLFFIDCRKSHGYRSSLDNPWEVWWAHFDGGASRGYYEIFRRRSEPVFESNRRAKIDRLLAEMLAISLAPRPETDLLNARLLMEMVTLVVTEGAPEAQAADSVQASPNAVLERVRQHLMEHFAEEQTLGALAERFHISKYHLSHEFKRRYGETPIEYLLQQRITRAKELLRFTDGTVSEIALACGFHEPSYFNRQFRRAEGLSASEYRNRWQG